DAGERFAAWWAERLVRLVRAGATGFRLIGLGLLTDDQLRRIIGLTRAKVACRFWAWTPGLSWARHAGLAGLGLDGVFASTPWWDGCATWYVEEHESLRRIAPVIGVAESPERVPSAAAEVRRRTLRLAATTAQGLIMPARFERDIEPEVRQ